MFRFLQDIPDNPFLLTGLAAGLLASVTCGVIGPYVVTRRIVFLAGAIAHTAVGGVGAALFVKTTLGVPQDQYTWLPLAGATVVAVGSAVLLGILHERVKERMDTLIGAVWAVGMAGGLLLVQLTPGYQGDLMRYLFGAISLVSVQQLVMLAAIAAVTLTVTLICHKRFMSICLDRQQSELQGVNVLAMDILLLCLVALTVITLVSVVGLILVIALLCLPAAAVSRQASRMSGVMLGCVLLCAALTTLPRMAVYDLTIGGRGVPPEPAIVIAAGLVYLAAVVVGKIKTTSGPATTAE